MFANYSKLLLQDFERKRESNQVPLGLVHLSLAQLRRDCLNVCSKRYERKKDEAVLESFFGVGYDKTAVLDAIDGCSIDKFRPLVYFLQGRTNNPSKNIIELLAWLIDFEKRPFELGKMYEEPDTTPHSEKNNTLPPEEFDDKNRVQETKAITSGEYELRERVKKEEEIDEYGRTVKVGSNENQETPVSALLSFGTAKNAPAIIPTNQPNIKKQVHFKALLWPSALVVVLVITFFLYRKDSCMYWAGDHFERISCDQPTNGVLIIPENSERIRNFKRITKPDTLTKKDINRVFYVKLDGELEYFTEGGFHPVYLTRSLKPLSEYIYNTHIIPLKSRAANIAGAYDSLSASHKDTTKKTVLLQ
ncbi:hypothetical protein ACTJIJ_15865 [Niabella sp. 22666]|jgi:hypothetical protein|uniref:hypothetical protein n=1 Tax=Niabella sp. 22666 TaxID=3453954 RepID=UPI003F8415B2